MSEYLTRDDPFFQQNMQKMNVFMAYILACLVAVGPLFAFATFAGVFKIPYLPCLGISLISLAFSIIQFLCCHYCKNQLYVMCQGMIFALLEPALILPIPNVGVATIIAFAVIPFLSCLYLHYKFSILTCLLSYNLMAVSLYFKSKTFYLTVVDCTDPMQWFIAELCGYTMISFFVLAGTISVSKLLNRTFARIQDKNLQINNIQNKLIQAFADTVEFNDPTTGLHVKRTSQYVNLIAHRLRAMGHYQHILTDRVIDLYTQAAPLHDIGKFSVPNTILCKTGKYTPEEYEVMKKHAQAGHELIENEFHGLEDEEFVKTASQMAWYHHEKWDGTGYPRGIGGTEIPLCGRIMAAADVLDALLSKRLYKEAFEIEETFEIIESLRGRQFEPCIVDALMSLKDEVASIISEDEESITDNFSI